MMTANVLYLAIGIILILIGATIVLTGRRKVADDGWSHPVGFGIIIVGAITAGSSFFN